VDVRVIATTNRDLEDCIERGEFRQDLYFRLNVVPIHVPPLRERREDILPLAEHFLERSTRRNGLEVRGLSAACRQALLDHAWPGNVRELQNVIERGVILCVDSPELQTEHFGLTRCIPPPSPLAVAAAKIAPGQEEPQTLHELEKRHIFQALERCRDNRTHAARRLGISVRTLRNKLNEYQGKTAPEPDMDVVPAN
jgi:DNA-binding NtrC family response regulator